MRIVLGIAVLAGLMLAPALAEARPRDAVMSAAFRCASLGPARMWLECYYGAAQPARTALGLAPAPASQVQLSRTAPATAAGPVEDSPTRDQVMSGAFACNGRPDEKSWLDCYYAAAQPMRARLGLAPAPQAATGMVRQAARALPASPVRSGPMPPAPRLAAPAGDTSNDTRIRLASYSFDKRGLFTVTLANGQSWRQREDDINYAHWKGPASGHLVSVSGGAFGHWTLEDERDHVEYQVQPHVQP